MDTDKHFFRIKTPLKVGHILSNKIMARLAQGPVLWLVSGGSTMDVTVECAKRLNGQALSNLTVSLVDERYGPIGHPTSNWRRLLDNGFELSGARLSPFLKGEPIVETLEQLKLFFAEALQDNAYKIGLLGMGEDGHTAGILPGSAATKSSHLVTAYPAKDYERLTLTFAGLEKLDEAILYAIGEAKAGQIDKLATHTIDPALQPAQVIKALPYWAVYNDRIGEEI